MKYPNDKGPRAKKSLGQNFLSDQSYINRIISAVGAGPGQVVIEIGPGRGALTSKLAATGADIIALELDRDLVPLLREKFASAASVRILEQDVLTADLSAILQRGLGPHGFTGQAKLAANLPYYISTAVLQTLAAQRNIFSDLVLMFQREVADRIVAVPGDSDRGFLTVVTEAAFSVERLFDVPPDAFRPVPKVWSTVVRLRPKALLPAEERFRSLVSAGFVQKRKTIANNLRNVYANYSALLEAAAIDPKARAEALSLEDWLRLHTAVESVGN